MKHLLLAAAVVVLAVPFAAHAQKVTADDTVAASEATNADLLTLVTRLRAQINADQRERADLLKRVTEAEKTEPKPAPSAPAPVNPK